MLRDEGLTIRGAKMLLARDRGASLRERGSLRLADLPEPDGDPDETVQDSPRDNDPMSHGGPKSRHRRRRISPAGMPAEDRGPHDWLGPKIPQPCVDGRPCRTCATAWGGFADRSGTWFADFRIAALVQPGRIALYDARRAVAQSG